MRLSPLQTKRQRGSAIVELSLILLVVLSLMVGIMDIGQFLYIHQMMTERARGAVRYGASTNPISLTDVQNMVLYGQTTGSGPGIFGLQPGMVSVTMPNEHTDDYRLLIKITDYPYTIFSPLIAGTYTGPDITAALPLGANF
jgi:TadE-like protein